MLFLPVLNKSASMMNRNSATRNWNSKTVKLNCLTLGVGKWAYFQKKWNVPLTRRVDGSGKTSISICFWSDATLSFSMIKCLSDCMPVGRAYGEKITIRQCLTPEVVFMQTTAPKWHHLVPLDPKWAVFGAWSNKCLFIMRRTFTAMQLTGCFNGTKTSYMPKD